VRPETAKEKRQTGEAGASPAQSRYCNRSQRERKPDRLSSNATVALAFEGKDARGRGKEKPTPCFAARSSKPEGGFLFTHRAAL